MFDSKIDEQYCNSKGEFVDIYEQLRLANGLESTDDEVEEAYTKLVSTYRSDICPDKDLALAMTQFADRAMEVLKDERGSYDARWQRARNGGGFWQRVGKAMSPGGPTVIIPEYYDPDRGGFVFETDERLDASGVTMVDDVDGLMPGQVARKEIKRVVRVGDAVASADRAAKILDRLHVDTLVSALGWVTAGTATIGVSAAAWSYFAYHGLRAGISWEQYFKAAGLQMADAAVGLVCPIPFVREAVDMHFKATEMSVNSAFPPALARALERARATGIREEDIEGALAPSLAMQAEWDAFVKELELKIYAFRFLSMFRRDCR